MNLKRTLGVCFLSTFFSSMPTHAQYDDFSTYQTFNELNQDPCVRSSDGSYSICSDGSVSYVQPRYTPYEGLCGQTAAANLIYQYCGQKKSNVLHLGKRIHDLTPGTLPITLENSLNQIFKSECKLPNILKQKKWNRYFESSTKKLGYIQKLSFSLSLSPVFKRRRADGTMVWRSPLPVVIGVPGTWNAHWVTVVDILNPSSKNHCKVIYNHYGTQASTPCSLFEEISKIPYTIWGLGQKAHLVFENS